MAGITILPHPFILNYAFKLVDLIKFEKALFIFKYKLKALLEQFAHYFTEVNNINKKQLGQLIKKITLLYHLLRHLNCKNVLNIKDFVFEIRWIKT